MRVLHIIGSVDPASGGPIEGILRQEAVFKRLLGRDREIVSLDSPDDPFVAEFPLKLYPLGIRPLQIHSYRNPLAHYGYTPKLIPWLRENLDRYDRIVVNGLWNYSTFGASQVLPRSGKPYFVFPHGMLDPWFKKQYPIKNLAKHLSWQLSEGPLLSNARKVLFTTEDEQSLARGAFIGHSYRSSVVGYGTTRPPAWSPQQERAFRKRVQIPPEKPFLLFLSRIHRKKGIDLLLRAFARVAQQWPDYDLVIAGPDQVGLMGDLRVLAEKLGIKNRIHWPGLLLGDEKWGAFRASKALILPSHQENFGIVVAEALACGTPVLISNRVNIWHEVRNHGAGLVADDDVDGTEAMLSGFFELSDAQKKHMGEAAVACFSAHFDLENVAEDFVKELVSTVSSDAHP